MANRLLRDHGGSVLVEAAVAFPLLLLITLGTIDVTYMLYDWNLASKAAYGGVRLAIVSDPVASGITNLTWDTAEMGVSCINSDGTPNTAAACPSVTTVCTPSSLAGGACSDGSPFDAAAFLTIFDAMQRIFPRLQPQNVQISYQTTGLGFVGRPGGLPMTVTVSIRCMTHHFFFINTLMGWLFSPLPADCPAEPSGPPIPAFASTLTSEDMVTN